MSELIDFNLLVTPDQEFKVGDKVYKVGAPTVRQVFNLQALSSKPEQNQEAIIEQLHLLLSKKNKITKEEIEEWEFPVLMGVMKWVFERVNKTLTENAEKKSLEEKSQSESD